MRAPGRHAPAARSQLVCPLAYAPPALLLSLRSWCYARAGLHARRQRERRSQPRGVAWIAGDDLLDRFAGAKGGQTVVED